MAKILHHLQMARKPNPSVPGSSEITKPNETGTPPINSAPAGALASEIHTFQQWGPYAKKFAESYQAVYVRFATKADGKRVILSSVGKFAQNISGKTFDQHPLPPGEGIELATTIETPKDTWHWKLDEQLPKDLALSNFDSQGYRITKLRRFAIPIQTEFDKNPDQSDVHEISYLKSLWGSDGTTLYVLAGTNEPEATQLGPRHLLKIDTKTWTIQARVALPKRAERFDDMCWSSQGLMLLKRTKTNPSLSSVFDKDLQHWFPLTQPTYAGCMLLTVDPDTLMPKQCWEIPQTFRIAGSPNSPFVYAAMLESSLVVIDAQKGKIVDQFEDRFQLRAPEVSKDGKSLFSFHSLRSDSSTPYSLNRYSIDELGTKITFAERREFDISESFFAFNPDLSVVTAKDKLDLLAFNAHELAKERFKTPILSHENGVFDPVSETVYVCGRASVEQRLVLKILQENRKVECFLDEQLPENRSSSASSRVSFSGNSSLPWMMRRVPYDMVLAPNGRGTLIFAEDAIYFVELAKPGAVLADNVNKKEIVSAAQALKPKPTEPSKPSFPSPQENIFFVNQVEHKGKGKVFHFSKNDIGVNWFIVDHKSGDIWLRGSMDNKSQYLGVISNKDLDKDKVPMSRGLIFDANDHVTFVCKEYRGRSLILLYHSGTLHALDSKTLLPVKDVLENGSIDLILNKDRQEQFFASATDDPFFYIAVDTKAKRFNLDTKRIEAENLNLPYWLENAPSQSPLQSMNLDHYEVDSDGIRDVGGVPLPKALETWPLPEESFLGNMRDNYIAVARNDSEFIFHDRNEFRNAKAVQAPTTLVYDRQVKSSSRTTPFLDDPKRKRLVFIGQQGMLDAATGPVGRNQRREAMYKEIWQPCTIWLLDYSEAEMPEAANVTARFRVPKSNEPGQKTSIELQLKDPRAVATIVKGPPQASVKDNKIVWTPTDEEVGIQSISLEIKVADRTARRTIECPVGSGHVNLPFRPERFVLSGTGDRAIAWHHEGNMALVDTKTRKALAFRSAPYPPASAVFSGDHLYLLYSDKSYFEKCSSEDLSVQETYSVNGQPKILTNILDKYLAFSTEARPLFNPSPYGRQSRIVEIPSLAISKIAKIYDNDKAPNTFGELTNGNWVVGPFVIDKESKSISSIFDLNWTGLYQFGQTPLSTGSSVPLPHNAQGPWRRLDDHYSIAAEYETIPSDDSSKPNYLLSLQVRQSSNNKISKHKIQILPFQHRSSGSLENLESISVSGNTISFLIDFNLFAIDAKKLGIKLGARTENPLPGIATKEKITVVNSNKKLDIKLSLTGDRGPLEISCEIGMLNRDDKDFLNRFLKVDSKKGTISIDGGSLLKRLAEDKNYLKAVLAEFCKRYAKETTSSMMVDQYLVDVKEDLKSLTKQSIKGVPFSMPMTIFVTNTETKSVVSLTHHLIVVLPRQIIEPLLTQPSDKGIAQSPPQTPKMDTRIPLLWNPSPELILSELQRRWPEKKLKGDEQIEKGAAIAALKSESKFIDRSRRVLVSEREWKLVGRPPIQGSVVELDAKSVIIQQADNGSDSSSSERTPISYSDFETEELKLMYKEIVKSNGPNSRTRFEEGSLEAALNKFRTDFGCFPPHAIKGKDEASLLSWRVLLLPYIGYSALFELFHLDEPWDSPHNQKLLPYMPDIYCPYQKGLEVGHSTVLAIIGPNTPFPLEGIRKLGDMKGRQEDIVLFAEVGPQFSVPWTKPEDLKESSDNAWREQLYLKPEGSSQVTITWDGDGKPQIKAAGK